MGSKQKAYGICLLLAAVLFINVQAQNKYRVFFKNKHTTFNPYTYFDQKAIDRRLKLGLPLADSSDFPVNQAYINTVTTLADSTRPASRWFNCMSVFTDAGRASNIASLPFVFLVEELEATYPKPLLTYDTAVTVDQRKLLARQIDMMNGKSFIDKGVTGKGVRICIIDAGFISADVNPAFEDIRNEKRIIATYDFAKDKEWVYGYNIHGTMVMSCIGGKLYGHNIGLATGAEFLLARTESPAYETYAEEEYWLLATEWADKNGADIINSSLGYTDDLHFKSQMDGRQSIIAKAATKAIKKGILVVNSAGNEGMGKWKIVASPADADSVLSVGAVDPVNGYHADFSSFGPNRDKKLKPNVSGAGTVLSAGRNGYEVSSGTSFSSPLVAGFAACVLELNPSWANTDLFTNIEKSGNLYPYYDYAHGYGVPQAGYFTSEKKEISPTFKVINNGNTLLLEVDSLNWDKDWKEREKLMYYHFENPKGYLDKYYVIEVESTAPLEVNIDDAIPGTHIRIHYRGYTYDYKKRKD